MPLEVRTTVGNHTEMPMMKALAALAVGKTRRKIGIQAVEGIGPRIRTSGFIQ